MPAFTDLEPGAYNVFVYSGQCEEAYVDNPVFIIRPQELCDNGLDDDGDGLTDCNDPDCSTNAECTDATERTICYGEDIDLGMETMDCASWESEDDIPNPHSNFINVQPDKTTIYKMHITNDQGELIETKTFTVNVTPEVSITPDPVILSDNGGVQVAVTPNESSFIYEWSNGEERTSATTTINTPGTYNVKVTAPNGCSWELNFNAFKVLTEKIVICKGECVEIGINPISGYTYTWQASDGLEPDDITTSKRTVCLNESKSYTLRVIDGTGFVAESRLFYLEVKHEDFEILPNPAIICDGQSIRLEITGDYAGSNVSWSNGNVGITNTVNSVGIYTAIVTTNDGCQLTASREVIDVNNCDKIQEWFEQNGFLAVPITASRLEGLVKDNEPLEKNGSGIVINDFANIVVTIGEEEVNLEQYLRDAFSESQFNTEGYITSNSIANACITNLANDNTFNQVRAIWENENLNVEKLVWMHICTSADGSGILFSKEKISFILPANNEAPKCIVNTIKRIAGEEVYNAIANANNSEICNWYRELRTGNGNVSEQRIGSIIGSIGEGLAAKSIKNVLRRTGAYIGPGIIFEYINVANVYNGLKIGGLHTDVFVEFNFWQYRLMKKLNLENEIEQGYKIYHNDVSIVPDISLIFNLDLFRDHNLSKGSFGWAMEVKTYKDNTSPFLTYIRIREEIPNLLIRYADPRVHIVSFLYPRPPWKLAEVSKFIGAIRNDVKILTDLKINFPVSIRLNNKQAGFFQLIPWGGIDPTGLPQLGAPIYDAALTIYSQLEQALKSLDLSTCNCQ